MHNMSNAAYKFDFAVIGAGFSGSLVAMALARRGFSVALVEKGTHPRFAIGESSTPLANLYLENICRKHNLEALLPLCTFGSWQKKYPDLPCGLKRGFSFFKQQPGNPFTATDLHTNELLVAASPTDMAGDTHWLRSSFDAYILHQAKGAGVHYFDQTTITKLHQSATGWRLEGRARNADFMIETAFLIDAGGGASPLKKCLTLEDHTNQLRTTSGAIYAHFRGVKPWQEIYEKAGGNSLDHPFPCDHAAVHHILQDGWMWQLHFNNGITSAGFVVQAGSEEEILLRQDAPIAWQKLLKKYPSLQDQFKHAEQVQDFRVHPRMQRWIAPAAGANWAMLPHACFFLDPLLSAGNAYSLVCVDRLLDILSISNDTNDLQSPLTKYSAQMQQEVDFLDRIIDGCYASFKSWPLFTAFSMYYFAGAIHQEERIRRGDWPAEGLFLNAHDNHFATKVKSAYARIKAAGERDLLSQQFLDDFIAETAQAIKPINSTGLCEVAKRNMYPYK